MFEDLFIKYCPIFYFHKNEPYMPANFDEILKISGITTPSDVLNANITMITIPKEKRTNVGLGTQILCRTNGIIQVGNIKYIDLKHFYLI